MNKPLLSLITAMDSNRLIGKNNSLPWHLPADLAFFKQTTLGKPVIMGRKTFVSIGKALPGRQNIVVTHNADFEAPDCEVASSIDHAVTLSRDTDEVMLIGGASLYEQSIKDADNIYLTLIHHEFAGDTWFPEIDPNVWNPVARDDFSADKKNPFSYSFVKYVRNFK
jgi:dihydrofolate reductase